MAFVIVFFPNTETSELAPIQSLPPSAETGNVAEVRWQGRSYKGKVLFIDSKELCEMKSSTASVDEKLVEGVYDVSCAPEQDSSPCNEEPVPTARERELMLRIARMEGSLVEMITSMKAMQTEMNGMSTAQSLRMDKLEQMIRELLRRNPAEQALGTISYDYVCEKDVAKLRELKGHNRNLFVLELEKIVFGDEPAELEKFLDDRNRSKDRINFIKQCLFKYYDVPQGLRDDVWKKAKDALNSRVREGLGFVVVASACKP
nr:unnamed protein product [Haemonchus contortus]